MTVVAFLNFCNVSSITSAHAVNVQSQPTFVPSLVNPPLFHLYFKKIDLMHDATFPITGLLVPNNTPKTGDRTRDSQLHTKVSITNFSFRSHFTSLYLTPTCYCLKNFHNRTLDHFTSHASRHLQIFKNRYD